jgi:DNA-binding CsgD family transcriptional regulator
LHRCALAALAQPALGQVDLARLSYHAEAAVDGGAVLRLAPAAAERAARAGAHRQARAEYSRALRFAQQAGPQDRAKLLEAFAREAYVTGAMERAATALFEAVGIRRESGDIKGLGECLGLLAQALAALGRFSDARSAGQESIAVLEQLPADASLARAYATLSGVLGVADDDEGLRLGLMAATLAEQMGDTGTLIHVLNNVGCIELRRGMPVGLDKLARSRLLAESSGDELGVGRAYLHTALLLVHSRDCLAAEGYLRSGIDYCFEHGFEAWLYGLTALDADCALARGRWSDAERIATAVLETTSREGAHWRCLALLVLATLRARRGHEAVWPLIDEAANLAKTDGAAGMVVAVAVTRAEVAWLENRQPDPEDADLLSGVSARLQPWYAYQLAGWRRRAGLPTQVPDGLPEPYRSQMADDHLHAAEWWAQHGCPYEAALALCDSGSPAALRRSLDELRRLGARPAAAIVARRLREAGERHLPRGPRPTTVANPAGLTAREMEVLALLASGRANKDIADRLVVSVRTVDHHVASILRKLEVRDRAAVRAVAAQLGIGSSE